MWTNIVEPDRPQTTVWRMRIACWIAKATKAHSEYVTLIAYTLRKYLYERSSMLLSNQIVFYRVRHLTLPILKVG